MTAKCTSPTSDLLKGRTVALKDNMAFAGVRCTNGTAMVDWVPDIDATIITRVLDAGATIIGKAGKGSYPPVSPYFLCSSISRVLYGLPNNN